jgi:anti-anti-sigma regulatory factor
METFVLVRLDGAALLWSGRRLTARDAAPLYRVLQELAAEGAAPIVVDLTAVPAVGEGPTAVLAACVAQLGRAGRGMVLCLPGTVPITVCEGHQVRGALRRAYPTVA